jgi:hypothetical protein
MHPTPLNTPKIPKALPFPFLPHTPQPSSQIPYFPIMHLTLTNTIRGLFTFGSAKKPESTDHSYEYIRGPIEERGPCPGLNALANQGYLYAPSLHLKTFSRSSHQPATVPAMAKT